MKYVIMFSGLFSVFVLYWYIFPVLNLELGIFPEAGHLMSNKKQYVSILSESSRPLNTFLNDSFGNNSFDDLIMDELLIQSYVVNKQEPIMLSKYFDKQNTINEVKDAIHAAVSSPDFFSPFNKGSDWFMDMNIFGQKNPSFDAYMMAKHLLQDKKKIKFNKIRILSISSDEYNTTNHYFPQAEKMSASYFHVNNFNLNTDEWQTLSQPFSESQVCILDQALNKNEINYLRLSSKKPLVADTFNLF